MQYYTPIKSPNDKLDYRGFILPNQLQAHFTPSLLCMLPLYLAGFVFFFVSSGLMISENIARQKPDADVCIVAHG